MRGMEHEVQMAVIRPLDEHLPNGMPSGDDGCAVVVRLRSRFHASRQMAPDKAGLDPERNFIDAHRLPVPTGGSVGPIVVTSVGTVRVAVPTVHQKATIGQMAYLQYGKWRLPRTVDCSKLGTCWANTHCFPAKPRIPFE